MDKKEKKSLPEPRTYTVEQIAAMLNIGRTTAYQLVKQEEFRIVRIRPHSRFRSFLTATTSPVKISRMIWRACA